jgi:hypothetical protein
VSLKNRSLKEALRAWDGETKGVGLVGYRALGSLDGNTVESELPQRLRSQLHQPLTHVEIR